MWPGQSYPERLVVARMNMLGIASTCWQIVELVNFSLVSILLQTPETVRLIAYVNWFEFLKIYYCYGSFNV